MFVQNYISSFIFNGGNVFFTFFRRQFSVSDGLKCNLANLFILNSLSYSPIHKAAGSLVTGRSLQNRKMSMGNHHTERPPDPVLYGGRPSGGFVNRAVNFLSQDIFRKITIFSINFRHALIQNALLYKLFL